MYSVGWTQLDTVADNASSGLIVLDGRMRPVHDLDLRLLGVVGVPAREMIDGGAEPRALGNRPAASRGWRTRSRRSTRA